MNKYLNILRVGFYLIVITSFALIFTFIYIKVSHRKHGKITYKGVDLPYKITIIAGQDTINIYNGEK